MENFEPVRECGAMHIMQRDFLTSIVDQPIPLLFSADEIATLQSLLDTLMKHDCGTNEHACRMVHWAVATAHQLHFSSEEVQRVYLATLLHDIGKIEVPLKILCKAGPLSLDEWNIIRCHAEAGYRIVYRLGGVFTSVAPLVLTHHERWDGSGYPLGLRKEEIPLSARILAVVDSFDAMTEERAYKRARTYTDACAELKRSAGRLYDPRVVKSFLKVVHTHSAPSEIASLPTIPTAA